MVAREPCDLLVIVKEAFRSCVEGNTEVAWQMMRSLVGRLRDADHKIESLALMDVYGRVAKLLLDRGDGKPQPFNLGDADAELIGAFGCDS